MKVPAMNLSLVMALQLLAAPFCLAAIPVLCIGLHLHRRIPRDPKLEGHRTVATTIAPAGRGAAIGRLAARLAAADAGCRGGRHRGRLFGLHGLAIRFPRRPCGRDDRRGHRLFGRVLPVQRSRICAIWQSQAFLIENAKLGSTMLNLTVSAQSGTALGGLFFVFAAISEYFARRGEKEHGAMYVAGSCAVAALGMMLVTWHGLSDRQSGLPTAFAPRFFTASTAWWACCFRCDGIANRSVTSAGIFWRRLPFGCFASISLGVWK